MVPGIYAVILLGLLGAVSAFAWRMQRRLVDNDIRLRTIIASEPECVKLQSCDGVVLEMNAAGLQLLEAKTPTEVIGHKVYEFLCPEHIPEYQELTRDVFAGKKRVLEFQVMGRQGTRRWLETNATPLQDKHGNINALLAITRDITHRKHLEKELEQKQMELHHVCRVSTIGEVASGIAHELNQPLCAISSLAETCVLLAETGHQDKLMAKLDSIVTQSQRASHIVSRLRDMATHKRQNKAAADIMEIIDDVISLTKHYLESNAVRLRIQVEGELPRVYVDKIQIEQVLFNLIRNAVEAMAANSHGRELTIAASDTRADAVRVELRDNGPGILAEHQKRVIDSYFSTKENGMGIGLSISRSIISAHGGRFWLDKTAMAGACFCFSLPTVGAEN